MKKIFYLISSVLVTLSAQAVVVEHFKHPNDALKIAARYLPENPVILEAGAYDGVDTLFMARSFPHAMIYSFEPIPYLYMQLHQKAKIIPNRIRTYQQALSDKDGVGTMYVSEEASSPNIPSQSSSLLAPKEHLVYAKSVTFKNQINVSMTTIDSWAKKHGVEKIDCMWLDMQGFELNALKASPNILKTVKVILTEVEFVEAYEGQYLFKDVKEWLEGQGFTMVAEDFGEWGWFGDALFVRI